MEFSKQITKSTIPCSLGSESITQNLNQQNTLGEFLALGFLEGFWRYLHLVYFQ